MGEKDKQNSTRGDIIEGTAETRQVFINGVELRPERSQKLRNHSPDGFCWGYAGSGPSQLALAILLEVTDDEKYALTHYQRFKVEVVEKLKIDKDFQIDLKKHWNI